MLLLGLLASCAPGAGSGGAAYPPPSPTPALPALHAVTPRPATPVVPTADATQRAAHPDAPAYAETFGVSLDEAIYRMGLMDDIGPLSFTLPSTYPETFAGLWLEHEPAFKLVVAFTADAAATLARHVAGTPLEAISEARTLPISYQTLQATQLELMEQLQDVPGLNTSGIDVQTNTIVLGVDDPAAFASALAAAGIELPAYVSVVQQGPVREE